MSLSLVLDAAVVPPMADFPREDVSYDTAGTDGDAGVIGNRAMCGVVTMSRLVLTPDEQFPSPAARIVTQGWKFGEDDVSGHEVYQHEVEVPPGSDAYEVGTKFRYVLRTEAGA